MNDTVDTKREKESGKNTAEQLSLQLNLPDFQENISEEDFESVYFALIKYIESEREKIDRPYKFSKYDLFRSINIFPDKSLRRYLSKSNINRTASQSLHQDWTKISFDLWSAILKLYKSKTRLEHE